MGVASDAVSYETGSLMPRDVIESEQALNYSHRKDKATGREQMNALNRKQIAVKLVEQLRASRSGSPVAKTNKGDCGALWQPKRLAGLLAATTSGLRDFVTCQSPKSPMLSMGIFQQAGRGNSARHNKRSY